MTDHVIFLSHHLRLELMLEFAPLGDLSRRKGSVIDWKKFLGPWKIGSTYLAIVIVFVVAANG